MSLTDSVEDKLSDQKASPARSRERLSTPEKRLHFRHSESETVFRFPFPPFLYDLPGDVDSVFAEGDKENSLTTQDDSDESNSLSGSHIEVNTVSGNLIQHPKPSPKNLKKIKAIQEWEIINGLKEGEKCEEKPEKYQGYLLKKRKWPLKGWHKRYFFLDKGILVYAKSPNEIQKGKYHGVIDIGLSVLCFKRCQRRIDIDAEELVHHVKVKDPQLFEEWLSRLTHHRLYRQHEITYGTKDQPRLTELASPTEEITSLPTKMSQAQNHLYELKIILEKMKNLPLATDSILGVSGSSNVLAASPQDRNVLSVTPDRIHLSCSNPNLITYEQEKSRPHSISEFSSLTNHEQRIKEIKLREMFLNRAQSVHDILKSLVRMVSTERDRLKQALEQNVIAQNNSNNISSLKESMAENCDDVSESLLRQNADLRARLSRIHTDSSVPDYNTGMVSNSPLPSPADKEGTEHNTLTQSFSAESCSMSEYYDAPEALESQSDTTSEASDEPSSEISDEGNETDYNSKISMSEGELSRSFQTGRRSKLPVPKPDTGDVSLWNLLCKNIGKDLTKISMPVTLNEPLSSLQRLCEELEYSELLDKASEFDDPLERMIYLAAFAVSCYASSAHRAGHKPFNPILGETYECIREDKGWRFISEQVSHHPPVSACHCDSRNFIFWQDVRIRTRFWGKSMEIQPIGNVNVFLPKYNDHYQWNKVTTCVHNLLGGQRWVDQYGEMHMRNGDISCKITFTKASYWSGKRHEIYGQIFNQDNKVVHNLFGKWNEAIYCGASAPSARCIWRPGTMTDDHALYYGFSRFAIELNELNEEEARFLPPTDSRFRPDQRLLEEGKLSESELEKIRIEQLQRDKRRQRDDMKIVYMPQWFRKLEVNGKEFYEFTREYWEKRKEPGFSRMSLPKLW
ncbi:oxysterol-binding protein-related protein 6 isoform X9 [Octopus bimaculoides]|uniref:oxysterol-binding protein-related protein 6 isoform X9 n=1 Tax=Octopus bimaculoides TaxID=37653 RepID=UPI0022E86808|nr:oxysterol-binding protein-related protein 6 isoform X9 [Octopus bimaculoides]